MIGEKKQKQLDIITFAECTSNQLDVLLTNDEGNIAEVTHRELGNNVKLEKSLDYDVPDDLNFNEQVIDVSKASNEIFSLTRRVKVGKNIKRDAQEEDTESW